MSLVVTRDTHPDERLGFLFPKLTRAERAFRVRWLVSGEHDRLRVESWEIEMAKRIAEAFRWGDEELAAVLLFRLAQLKSKVRTDIHDWCAFVAQSLYNAAKNFIRREDVIRARQRSLDCTTGDSAGLLDHVAERAEPTRNQCSFSDVRKRLTPEMRQLADLLIQNEGNISAVSKALGRPRKTVEYWVVKLRASLQKLGVEP